MDAGRAEALRAGGGTVVALALDGMKSVNDRWGHEAGDAFLRHFTSMMTAVVSPRRQTWRPRRVSLPKMSHGKTIPGEALPIRRSVSAHGGFRAGLARATVVALLASRGLALADERSLEPVLVAGGGTADGGAPVLVDLKDPESLAVDGQGRVYVADREKGVIFVLDFRHGTAETITGPGSEQGRTSPGPASNRTLPGVQHIALDPFRGVFFAQEDVGVVFRYDLVARTVERVAGRYSEAEFDGDGGPATKAVLRVHGLACDAEGNLYVSGANRIRRISRASGLIRTVAGTGKFGFWGDGGPATEADLANPGAMAFDRNGTLYFCDRANNRIRAIDPKGRIRTVAGNGRSGPPEDGVATRSAAGEVVALAVDGDGDVVFVTEARFVRRLLVSRNRLETFLQSPWSTLHYPREITGVAVGAEGSLYFDVPRSNGLMSLPAALLRKESGSKGSRR